MPNWVTNELSFPVKEDLEKVIKLMGETDGDIEVDFNKIIPMPESLNIEDGTATSLGVTLISGKLPNYISSQEELQERIESIGMSEEELKELGQVALDNEKKYGSQSWYGWSIENWGTKWNSNEGRLYGDVICFETAWSTPYPVLKELSRKLGIEIEVRYADEDTGSNVGEYTFNKGKLTHEYCPDEHSKEAYELAFDINGGEGWIWDENEETYMYDEDY